MATDPKLASSGSQELQRGAKTTACSRRPNRARGIHTVGAQKISSFESTLLCRALETPECFAIRKVESVANRSAFKCPVTRFVSKFARP